MKYSSCHILRYANGVHLSALWGSTALVLIHRTCAVFSHMALKMNNVCIFSHDQVTHDIHNCHRLQLRLQLECDMG